MQQRRINDAGKKIAYRAADIEELIKKKPTFEDIENEEEDDTLRIMIQTEIHMAKMLTLLLRMMIRLLLSYLPVRRRFLSTM